MSTFGFLPFVGIFLLNICSSLPILHDPSRKSFFSVWYLTYVICSIHECCVVIQDFFYLLQWWMSDVSTPTVSSGVLTILYSWSSASLLSCAQVSMTTSDEYCRCAGSTPCMIPCLPVAPRCWWRPPMNTTDVQGQLQGCVGDEYLLCVLQYLLLNPVLGFTSTSCLGTQLGVDYCSTRKVHTFLVSLVTIIYSLGAYHILWSGTSPGCRHPWYSPMNTSEPCT